MLLSPILLDAAKTRKITLACCVLHSFLLTKDADIYAPISLLDHIQDDGSIIEGSWRQEQSDQNTIPLERVVNTNRYATENANNVREKFKEYFMSINGEVPWQFMHI